MAHAKGPAYRQRKILKSQLAPEFAVQNDYKVDSWEFTQKHWQEEFWQKFWKIQLAPEFVM